MAHKKNVLSPETEKVLTMLVNDLAACTAQARSAREILKHNLVQAIVDNELSVQKASQIAGIDRRTITLWLTIHNAEKKHRDTP